MNAYEEVRNVVKEYWKKNGISDVALVIELDGHENVTIAFCESDSNPDEVEFLNDFWEGEEEIKVTKITELWKILYKWSEEE